MATRRVYPRPPIVEAIIDLALQESVSGEDLAATLSAALGQRYSGEPKRQDLVTLHASWGPAGVGTAANRVPHLTFLRTPDGLRLLGCGNGALSVHVLAPYPGWESFIEQGTQAVEALPEEVRRLPLRAIGVRYIDRIRLPAGAEYAWSDYIQVMPPCPASMPRELVSFQTVTQAIDSETGALAALTVASVPTPPGEPSVVQYDLAMRLVPMPPCTLLDETWLSMVNALHERERDIFEESITDRLRGTFE